MARAIDDLETRLGPVKDDGSNWNYGSLFTFKYQHAPFGETPLRSIFEIQSEGYGNRRTINMNCALSHGKEGPFVAIASAVFRQITDTNDPTSTYITIDLGVESMTLQSENRSSFKNLHDAGKYFRLAT